MKRYFSISPYFSKANKDLSLLIKEKAVSLKRLTYPSRCTIDNIPRSIQSGYLKTSHISKTVEEIDRYVQGNSP